MRRFTKNQWMLLALAGAIIMLGLVMVLHPAEMDVPVAHRGLPPSIAHWSKDKAQGFGVVLILLGAGTVWVAFYGNSK
jgi:hypothetical protein